MASSSYDDDTFQRAVERVADPKNATTFTNEQKLNFYALFKQATVGDLPLDRPLPSRFAIAARAKHEAWDALRGTSGEEAKKRYVAALCSLDKSFVPLTDDESTLKNEESLINANVVTDEKSNSSLTGSSNSSPQLSSEIEIISTRSNAMLGPAIAGCAFMIGIGIGGFLFTILSWTALGFLGMAFAGVVGLVGSMLVSWDERGLLGIMPRFATTLLLETTLLEFLLEDRMLVEMKQIIVQVLPALLANDEKKMLEALSHMSSNLRQNLTTKGMIHLLTPKTQRILLPRVLRQQIMNQPPTYRLPPAIAAGTNVSALRRVVSEGNENDPPRLDSSRELFRNLFAEVVSKKNVEFVLNVIDPNRLKPISAVLGSIALLQLIVSRESRKILIGFIRACILLGSLFGAGACGGLVLIWIGAKRRQKKMGW